MTWKDFELITQKIQQELAPDAAITLNEKIVGKSGIQHQCDVVIRSRIGQYEFICIMECKDLVEKVGLDIVRSFFGRLDDLNMPQGVIVSAKGYTKNARQYAKSKGIITYTLFDASSVKWQEQALLPIMIEHIELESASLQILDSATESIIKSADERGQPLFPVLWDNIVQAEIGRMEICERAWDEILPMEIPKPEKSYESERDRYVIDKETANSRRVFLKCSLQPRVRYYYNHVSLSRGRGFLEHRTSNVLIGDYEASMDFREALSSWPFTYNRNDVPIRPVEVFFLGKYFYKRFPQTPMSIIFGRKRAD